MKRALEWLGGSVLVYAVMAACSAGGGASKQAAQQPRAGAPATAEGGQPGLAAGGATDPSPSGSGPVPNAMAAGGAPDCGCEPYVPPAPTIVEAKCDTQADGSSSMWAIVAFPGKSALELSRVIALIDWPPGFYKWPPGFTQQLGVPLISDGSVAVVCGAVQSPGSIASKVTFVLP